MISKYERELGAVAVEIKNLEKGQEAIRDEIKKDREETEAHREKMRTDLAEIKGALRDVQVAWKTTAIISSVISALVAGAITAGKLLIPFLPR